MEHAGAHIHDAANRKQGNKLKRLYIYAWPCLLSKQCVDPATKYHGFYLQAHIIIKFAIHKKFVLQVVYFKLKLLSQNSVFARKLCFNKRVRLTIFVRPLFHICKRR